MDFLKKNFVLNDSWKLEHMQDDTNNLDVFINIDLYAKSKETSTKKATVLYGHSFTALEEKAPLRKHRC